MWKTWKRWWRYVAVMLRVRQDEIADPKVQLVQAMEDARLAHRRATEQAAAVVANQRVAQKRLEKLSAESQKLQVTADQALLLAEQQRQSGDPERAEGYEQHAEAIVVRVMELDQELGNQRQIVQQAGVTAEHAKAKVAESDARLREKLRDSERLLNDLDRAKMYEALNEANRRLDDTLADDGPTYAGVERKIDKRLESAIAAGEIADSHVPSADQVARDVNQAVKSVQAQAFLDDRRAMLGLAAATPPVPLKAVGSSDDETVVDVPPPPRRRSGS